MARRKTIQEINSMLKPAIELAKNGMLKNKTVLISCGAGLYVTVNNNTASTSWVARVAGKMTRLGDVDRMKYKTARAKVDKLQQDRQKERRSEPEKTSPTLAEISAILEALQNRTISMLKLAMELRAEITSQKKLVDGLILEVVH